jgi:ATP-binding cassette subfamily B (MDR/TAP) protein 1
MISKQNFFSIFRYSKRNEKILMLVGVFFSVVAGAALPISTVFIGDMVDAMSLWEQRLISVEAFLTAIETKVVIYIYLAGNEILNT